MITTFPSQSNSLLTDERVRFLRSLVSARTDFARDFLAYGRMQRPPSVECGTIEIDHGLAEGGWLRKARFSKDPRVLESAVPFADSPADEKDRAKELSVEQWVKDLLALDATPAKNPTIRVPSVVCQAYTLEEDRLGILLVNLRRDAKEPVRLTVDPVAAGLARGEYRLEQVTVGGKSDMGEFRDRRKVESALPPRGVILLVAERLGDLS
jgi:hypothetical protein